MGFRNIRAYADAFAAGQVLSSSFRKIPSQASTAGQWVDLSMAAGNPVPNYYASSPLVAAVLDPFRGMFHGDGKAPAQKFLTGLELITPTAAMVGQYKLFDYVMYYPFVDLDDLDVQAFDNTVTLPRYQSGDGLMAMMVAVAPTIGSGQFRFDYINQAGVLRTSPTQFCGTASTPIASLVTSQPGTVGGYGPFLTLAQGDTGIRRIVSYQNLVSNGGLGAIVLVRPLADHAIREINTAAELQYVQMKTLVPEVVDGAYLNMICNCSGSVAAGTLAGRLDFVWN